METLRFTVSVHEDEDGSYWAQVREWPGCIASGRDLNELREGIDEAITMYLESVTADELAAVSVPGEALPPPAIKKPRRSRGSREHEGRSLRVDGLSLVREA